VLFDVDGTLLSAGGAGRRALDRALRDVYGTAGPIDSYDLLGAAGLPPHEIAAREARLFAQYAEHLEAEVGDGRRVTLYPGVAVLVERLTRIGDCVVGLLTGNIEAGARIKLRSTGLWSRFRLGAYGSDHADRTRLPAVAARRAEALMGRAFRGSDVVIIGDTPRDIGCARAFDAMAIGVATGRHSVADLEAHAPDHVFQDLADTEGVLAAIFDGAAPR
jgi:phosphoglycolate phosphatase-like HAD superfamily hydrolase